MEDYAIILDYLSLGYVKEGMSSFKKKPVAQAIGTENFTLLELIPREGEELEIHEKVYIGSGKRDKINRVKGKLDFENLTATSRVEIDYVIGEIISAHEDKYVQFFNEAGPLSTRLNKLELLPGIGKKVMWEIIEEREKEPFKSFEDITKRVPLLSHPIETLAKRIRQELDTTQAKRGKNKYRIFTQPPARKGDKKKGRRGDRERRNSKRKPQNKRRD
jgi:putative nucleotide binding protein